MPNWLDTKPFISIAIWLYKLKPHCDFLGLDECQYVINIRLLQLQWCCLHAMRPNTPMPCCTQDTCCSSAARDLQGINVRSLVG